MRTSNVVSKFAARGSSRHTTVKNASLTRDSCASTEGGSCSAWAGSPCYRRITSARVVARYRPVRALSNISYLTPDRATTISGETCPVALPLSYANAFALPAGFEPAADGLNVVPPAFVERSPPQLVERYICSRQIAATIMKKRWPRSTIELRRRLQADGGTRTRNM
jgi:hypothetical protein